MWTRLLVAVLAVGSRLVCAGQNSTEECNQSTVSIKLEAGDSLIGLFGNDWEKVWRCNATTILRNGRPARSPDLVIEGAMLRVPAGTRLTPLAEARIEEFGRRRTEMLRRLNELGGTLQHPNAQPLLHECRRLLESDRRYFADLDYVARQLDYLGGLAKQRRAPWRWQESRTMWPWAILLAALSVLVTVGCFLVQLRANTDVAVRQQRAAQRLASICNEAGIRIRL